ncbi:MAG: acetyl-CoA carboxylase carboxyltransferase subunit alpha [Fimbriimonadaceae bacterium]|nr:acetyl-CoA carboxylase carboxyltransferase subunit alpha [Fimbriimonadaceae bacterium]
MAKTYKEWMQPLRELEEGIANLESLAAGESGDKAAEIAETIRRFRQRRDNYIETLFSRLGPWERVLLARAEQRPYTLDYVSRIFSEFLELAGDRAAADDHAIVGGPALFQGRPVIALGHQKGRNLTERTDRNYAMAKPEGYRKAIRLFRMAERFRMPVLTFVDTPAADPGVESESRGISEAIASSMLEMVRLTVPVVSVVIGEGGSGGALGIAVANRVLMLEHSIYSVIPPEGCAAILWRAPEKGPQAAAALQLTAQTALELGVVEQVIPEPFGGAHRDYDEAAAGVRDAIALHLSQLDAMSPESLKADRYDKFRRLGSFSHQDLAAVSVTS